MKNSKALRSVNTFFFSHDKAIQTKVTVKLSVVSVRATILLRDVS